MKQQKLKEHKEPWLRIAKRVKIPWWKAWGIRAMALVFGLLVCAGVIYAVVKMNPLEVYKAMAEGAFGTNKRLWVTIRDMMLLLCIGVGLAPAFKMRFWNIGAEGQLLVGAIAAAACMIYLGTLPAVLLLVVMLLCSAVAGGVWGLVPGIFKAKWNTNETLFTLMMNYIALQLTAFFVMMWENPRGSSKVGIINPSTRAGWFPPIFGQDYALNVILVLTLAVGMYLYLQYSKQGYEIAVVGESENTARYAGIRVPNVVIRTMTISGAVCGIAGFLAVSGASHTISMSTAGGRGFTAIIVAWLAKFNTFVMVAIAGLLVFLDKGAVEIASRFKLSNDISNVIAGILLFFIIGCEFFIQYRMKFRSGAHKEVQP